MEHSSKGYKMLSKSKKLKIGFQKGNYRSFYSQHKPNSHLATLSAFVAESVIGLSLGRNLSTHFSMGYKILPKGKKLKIGFQKGNYRSFYSQLKPKFRYVDI